MKKATTIWIVVLSLVALALIVVPNVLPKKPAVVAEPQPTVYSVKTVVATQGNLRQVLELTGDVTTETNVAVYPDVAGKLAAVYVQVGDRVTKGKTVIAAVDPSRPGASYALSEVTSPLTGTVTTLTAQLGATVGTSTSLGTVGILTDLRVEAKVPEADVALVRTGLQADIEFEAFPGRTFAAVVERVSPVVDATSRTKTIRLGFTGDASRVDLGMFAQIRLALEARPTAVHLPETAVLLRQGKHIVFVVADGKVVRREVSVGVSVEGTSEVLEGVKVGEEVVVRGQELLDDGSSVRVVR